MFEGNMALLQDGSTHLTWGEVRLLASEGLFHIFTIPRMETIKTTAIAGAFLLTTTAERGGLWHDRLGRSPAQSQQMAPNNNIPKRT